MSDALKNLKDDHKDFTGEGFVNPPTLPFELFSSWFDAAVANSELEANALCLSTVGDNGIPSSRMVYLKEIKDNTFIFFTNYNSQKGRDLEKNPVASILFFWPKSHRQVRITGIVSKISKKESDAYFASRPRDSQLGAWASFQSEILDNRSDLISRFEEYSVKYPEQVPRPPHWGGYALSPIEFEFWQGQQSRLHDRLIYVKYDHSWKLKRKNP